MFKGFLKRWLGWQREDQESGNEQDDANALLGQEQEVVLSENELEVWLNERLSGRGGVKQLRLRLQPDGVARLQLQVVCLGTVELICSLADLWHDRYTSSLELKLHQVTAQSGSLAARLFIALLLRLSYLVGPLTTSEGVSLRLAPDAIQMDLRGHVAAVVSPKYRRLRHNLVIIGGEVLEGQLLLHIHRVPSCRLEQECAAEEFFSPQGRSRLLAAWHWLLLITYVFILIHLTFPVVQRAFTFVYSDTGQGMRFLWSFIYDILVLVMSFFFLRLTMFPFYVHWWRYKHEVSLLRMEEAKDRQYLQILDRWFKDFREMYHALSRNKKALVQYRQQLRDAIRDVGRQRRLLAEKQEYLDAQHWNWMRQIIVGYLVAFGLEWLYINEILPPLDMTLDWVNQLMAWLLR